MMTNKDKTGTARQQARRLREKEWLKSQGLNSWEQLHTKLMNGTAIVIVPDFTPEQSKQWIQMEEGKKQS
jgi:hypothetical protein